MNPAELRQTAHDLKRLCEDVDHKLSQRREDELIIVQVQSLRDIIDSCKKIADAMDKIEVVDL